MKLKFVFIIVILFLHWDAYAQFESSGVVIPVRISGDGLDIERLSDTVFLILGQESNPQIVYFKEDSAVINKAAYDLCLWKISAKGDVLGKLSFQNINYETAEKICVAKDAVYLTSKVDSGWSKYLSLKKLNTEADKIILDTVLPLLEPYDINCMRLPDDGIALIYNLSDAINHRQTGLCPIYFDEFRGKDNTHTVNLISKKAERFIGFYQKNDSVSSLFTQLGKDTVKEVSIDIHGTVLSERCIKHIPDYFFDDGGYTYFGPYASPTVILPRSSSESPQFKCSYAIKYYKTDDRQRELVERILVPDTSLEVWPPPQSIRTKDGDIIIYAVLRSDEKVTICFWKLDNNLNVLWRKQYDNHNYGIGECKLFENSDGYIFLAVGKGKLLKSRKYGKQLIMINLDNDGTIIND